MSWKIVTNPMV